MPSPGGRTSAADAAGRRLFGADFSFLTLYKRGRTAARWLYGRRLSDRKLQNDFEAAAPWRIFCPHRRMMGICYRTSDRET